MHWWNLNRYLVIDADIKIISFREPEAVILDHDPYERVYNDLPAGHLVLRKMPICQYCGAIRLPNEGLNFYCRQGKVNTVSTPIPPDQRRLFTSQSDRDALYFRKNIRYFNSHFSFTSFGANVDHKVATAAGEHSTTISP